MVTGRTHETEDIFAVARGFQGIQRGGRGRMRVAGDVFIKRRVRVKILRNFQTRQVFRGMRAQNLLGRSLRPVPSRPAAVPSCSFRCAIVAVTRRGFSG